MSERERIPNLFCNRDGIVELNLNRSAADNGGGSLLQLAARYFSASLLDQRKAV